MINHKKIVVITGCSSGLGFEICKKFIKENFFVYGISSNKKKINNAKKIIYNKFFYNNNFSFNKVDVSNQNQIKIFFSKLFKKHKRLDVVINNAAVYGPIGYFEKNNLKSWKKAFDINFYGCLNVYREAVKIMKKKKYGRIIQISGGGSTKPLPMFTSYACSKVGVVRLAECISEEVKKYNICINSVSPGILNTVLLKKALKAGPQNIGKKYYNKLLKAKKKGGDDINLAVNLIFELSKKNNKINGKIISALWDEWHKFKYNFKKLNSSDVYTLRRIVGKERNLGFFDK